MTRLARVLALTALVAFAIATPLGGRAFGRACAAGNVHVAIIVDLGSGGTVSALCVPINSGANGESVLSARASTLGTPQPRYASSGLLCAIDGVPSTGCGVAHDGHFSYWSYWHGSGGNWSYANNGPGSTTVTSGAVEGWRWQPDGTGHASDPPPRGPASATAVCPAPAPPTTAARPPIGIGPKTVTSTPPAAPITASTPAPGSGATAHPTGAVSPAGAKTSRPTTPSPGTTHPVATTPGRGHSTTTTSSPATSSSVELVPRGIASPPAPHSSGGVPVGAIVGVTLVVALGGAGAVVARRRRTTT